MSAPIDLTGQKFNKLTVLNRAGSKHRECLWKCRCECGNITYVTGYSLRSGKTKSCGCIFSENVRKANTKHGLYGTRIHGIYYNMKNRCYNPHYYLFDHYGGKGITVCNEWLGDHGLENFYNWAITHGYDEKLSIDRIDNSKGYSPKNCRWATMKEQQNNRTNNRILTLGEESHTMSEWADITGISYGIIQKRLSNGCSIEKVLAK